MPAWTRSRSHPKPPAFRRVNRLKQLTAFLLMVLLTLGLLLFGLVVVRADAGYERDRVDRLLERQVAAASDGVGFASSGRLVVDIADDPHLAGGYPQVYVAEVPTGTGGRGPGRIAFAPSVPFWPDADVLDVAGEAVRQGGGAPLAVVDQARRIPPTDRPERIRLLAQVVDDGAGAGPRSHAVVVGVAAVTSGEATHDRLVGLLWWSAAAILTLGILLAAALARGRFWLVDLALARHEQFLHDTAHELRGPLASLRAITEAGLTGDTPPEEALERAMGVVQSTDEVIADLISLTRIETGRDTLDAELVRLDLLVETLVSQRPDGGTIVVRSSPTVVRANPELLRRAVANLVENAVRHGRALDASAEILVEVGQGRLTVTDGGPGVAPQLLPHLLERTTTDGQRTGSGLGLALTAWVARVHGGRLQAANRSEGGAVFTLELATAD